MILQITTLKRYRKVQGTVKTSYNGELAQDLNNFGVCGKG